ncbi:MAG: hypothetical protein WCT11_01160 [Candidatus Magasanikbacteria bacterium]
MLITISELIHQSWSNYLKTLRRFAPFLGVLLVGFIIRYFLGFVGLYLDAYTKLSNLSVDITITLIMAVLAFLAIWTTYAMVKSTQLIQKNLPLVSFKESYIRTAHYIIPTFLLSLLVALIVITGSILFLIPGIIFAVWYYYVNYVVIFEDQKDLSSFKTSKQLIVGRWFSMALRIVIPKIIFLIVVIILNILVENIIFTIFNPSVVKINLIIELVYGIIASLTLPLFIWSDTILYFSAKENPTTNLPPIIK